jgi:hypothetical protein
METNGKQEKKTKGISHIQIINIVQKVLAEFTPSIPLKNLNSL